MSEAVALYLLIKIVTHRHCFRQLHECRPGLHTCPNPRIELNYFPKSVKHFAREFKERATRDVRRGHSEARANGGEVRSRDEELILIKSYL
jgi:hypothetical protein